MHATRSSDHAHRRWRFAIFEVDLDSGELTRRGVRVPLPEKPFQVLQALIERPGELVTRKQLCERLWSADTFVDFDNNLNAAVRRLREALGDSANRPRFVETLPKRGYRLLAPVEAIEPAPRRRISPDEAPRADVADVADGHPTGLLGRRPILGLVVTLTLVVLVLVLRAAMAGKPAPGGEGPTPTGATPQRLMLAVLPFTDLDRRPDRAFFRDGLTEELITQLGRLQPERLGVIARMSSMHYRDSTRGVDQIGAELGVGYLLEGSLRSTDTRTRITVQLVQVADRTQIWGETYDVTLDDLLRVQGDVAVAVAQALALELLPEQPLAQARAGTRDTAAYEAYLRGRYAWHTFTSEGYDQAIAAFGRAVEIDPRYAAAWAGLAQAHNLDAFTSKSSPGTSFPAARHAAQTALALAPDLAAAHNALAFVQLYHDYDPRAADRSFRHAASLAPNDAMIQHWWAGALAVLGRHGEAIEAIHRAATLDPLSLSVLSDLGWYYLFANRWEDALRECRAVLEVSAYGWAENCIYIALIQLGRFEEALPLTAHADPTVAAELSGLAPAEIHRELTRRQLAERLAATEHAERFPIDLAFPLAALGDSDGAFHWLEKAYALHQPWLIFLQVDPRLDALAQDPRYQELARRLGLPPAP